MLILSAENPFTFLAFCLNMRELHKNLEAIIKTPDWILDEAKSGFLVQSHRRLQVCRMNVWLIYCDPSCDSSPLLSFGI